MKMKRSIALSLMLLCSMGMVAGCGTKETPATAAEKYPDKPITIIVPFAAGGINDMMARAMEKAAQKHLGQSLIVKNIPGGAATVGLNELAGSDLDGYTIGTVTNTTLLQPLYGKTRYHYPSALDPLVQIMDIPAIAVVRADQPWNDMKDLINYANKHPESVKFGHPGLGTGDHVVGELLAKETGTNLVQVPFKGESEALAALLGGHIQLTIISPPTVQEYVKSGKVRVIGVAAKKRMSDPVFSNAPTFQEQGIDIIFSFWVGVAAPKVLPVEVKSKLVAGLEKVVNDPEYIQNMKALGMDVTYIGQEEFLDKWLNESERLRRIVKETGIAEKIAAQKN